MRDGHFRQEEGGVDSFGAVRAQDGGQDGAGGDVDGDRQLRPTKAAVLKESHDVQAICTCSPGRCTTGDADEARAGAVAVRAGRSAGSASTLTSR